MAVTLSGLKSTQHSFRHNPESPVELHISVDTTHGAGKHEARRVISRLLNMGKTNKESPAALATGLGKEQAGVKRSEE